MKRHGIPVMCSAWRWGYEHGIPALVGARRFLWTPSPRINSRSPGDPVDERFRRDELSSLAIQHIEESVLRRLHDDLARYAVDPQIREHQRLRGVVVPVVSRRYLIVPNELAVIRSQRHYGCEVQIVAAAGATQISVPRDSVAGAGVDQIE